MDFFDDDFDLTWQELGMLGSLAEELSEEAKERIRAELETYSLGDEDEDNWI